MDTCNGRIYSAEEAVAATDDLRERLVEMQIPPTVRQQVRGKVGRNDPCPCGSGKKFKTCHLARAAAPRANDALGEVERRRRSEEGVARVRAEAIAQGHAPEVVDAEIDRIRGVVLGMKAKQSQG